MAIGVDVHAVSALTADGVDALAEYLRPGVTVGFVGSSGVGKSTLLNRLLGRDVQATAGVRAHDSRGRHTTTHRELFVLPQGGLVIDTPGMREFTLSDADEGAGRGLRRHRRAVGGLPLCRLRTSRRTGMCGPGRGRARRTQRRPSASYEKLLKELRYEESRGDQSAAAERKRQGRIGAKAIRRMKRDG